MRHAVSTPGCPGNGSRWRRAAVALALAGLLALQGCALTPSAQVVRVEADDSEQTIELQTGQVLEIVMHSYPANNLTLSLGSVVTPTLAQAGRPTFHDDTIRGGVSGTGSYEVWRFRAVQAGELDVRMDYRLPWQATGKPTRSVTYQVVVR